MHQFEGNPNLNTQTSNQVTTHSNYSLISDIYTHVGMLIHCLWFTFYAFFIKETILTKKGPKSQF